MPKECTGCGEEMDDKRRVCGACGMANGNPAEYGVDVTIGADDNGNTVFQKLAQEGVRVTGQLGRAGA